MSDGDGRYDGSEIAIVGMAGRFPGAADLEAFWRNLREGRESIRFFSREELERAGVEKARLDDPLYVRARPVLEDVELFDAAFFGLSPREASVLDPQHRLFLECAFHALEDAGCDPERFPGPISVYAGASFSNYLVHNLYKNRPLMDAFGDLEATIHNVPDSLATLVGYKLNLRGACCAVQTFCSTSLVAVHAACQSLLGFESDMALAGGVTVYVPQESGYLFQEGSIVSPDGHCRAFDARAGGTVFGNGVGVVVLRRLRDALADGARIDAVIRGTAVNNDGALKASFAAPGVSGQAAVVVEALSAAGVDPDTIGMVEAHGTGTALGDPAEVAALTKAFRRTTRRRGFCALGSVKTNVGHLDAAAGVAGLVKLVLSIQNRAIPPSLHFETLNPAIDFESSPFYVNARLREWPGGDGPRRGGVSAFGVGGTNAHVIVEEAPEPPARPATDGLQILPLAARTPSALAEVARRLADHLEAHPELDLGDVAFTLQSGRRAFDERLFLVARRTENAVAALRAAGSLPSGRPERRNPPLVAVLLDPEGEPLAAQLRSWGITFEATAEPEEIERAIRGLPADDGRIVVEFGASQIEVLRPPGVRDQATGPSGSRSIGDPSGADPSGALLHTLGTLWLHGVEPSWDALHPPGRRRVRLPAYPFERQRHWVEPIEEEPAAPSRDPASWLYRPVWKPLWPAPDPGPPASTLVFLDEGGLGAAVASRLREAGTPCVTVAAGSCFAGDARAGYTIDPGERAHYRRLFDTLLRDGARPEQVLHLWSLDAPLPGASPAERFRQASARGFYSVLDLVAAGGPRPMTLHAAASGLFEVVGGEALRPEAAPLLAAVRVATQEDPALRGSVIDLEPALGPDAVEALVAQLGLAEPEILLAVRRGRVWVQDLEPVPAAEGERFPPRPRPGGCFLVTGGLGDVAFLIGVGLVRQGPAKLVLLSRSGLPPRAEWTRVLESPATPRSLSRRIRKVLALEHLGAEVLVVRGDVARVEDVLAALRAGRERFGRLDGVVHAAGEMATDTFAPVARLSREACERQFAPKVHGTIALAEALREEGPDFCLVTSSLSTLLGGTGYAAYAGANAFEDAFAAHASRGSRTAWVSVDFDQWQLAEPPAGEIARRAVEEGAAMGAEEGLAVVERVLRLRQLSRVVVSVAPLADRMRFLAVRPAASRREGAAVEAVERTLAGLEGIDAAAVVERETPAGGRELVAFVTFGAGAQPTTTELRRAVRERLPGSPVPASFVVLDALPRAEDGGIDREALRGLDGAGAGGAADLEPRTPHERLLATLFREALGIEKVTVRDNFFDLGGHSLLSIRVIARLEKATGLRLDPRDMIFQSLGQIAATCDERRAAAGRAARAAPP